MVQYPWKLYDKPVYWSVPDDGAPLKCKDCGGSDHANKFWFTQTPNGKRAMIHKDCIDEDWLKNAQFLGEFPIK